MIVGSNSLTVLAAEARKQMENSKHHQRKSVDSFLSLGGTLSEAKSLCAHGEWGAWLKSAEVNERTAQRAMRLHKLGLKSDTVSGLGGIKSSLTHFQHAQLPNEGEALLAIIEDEGEPCVAVWKEGKGHHVIYVDPYSKDAHYKFSKRPILTEMGVWVSVWHLLDYRFSEIGFGTAADLGATDWIEELIELHPHARRAAA